MLQKVEPSEPYFWISLNTGGAVVKSGNEMDDLNVADQRFEAGNYFDVRIGAAYYAEMINLTLQARNHEPEDYNTPNIKRAPKGQRYFYLTANDNADMFPSVGIEPITAADRHAAAGNYFASKEKAQAAADTLNELRRKLAAETGE